MEKCDVKRLGRILAIQAEIEGMKVANEMRLDQGLAPKYGETAFNNVSELLKNVVSMSNNELYGYEKK